MLNVHIVIPIILLGFSSSTVAFLWDEYNLARLFKDADIIFNDIITEVDESDKLCVNQFKYFVDKLQEGEEWALKCKFFLVEM